jgi:hypothetical protein
MFQYWHRPEFPFYYSNFSLITNFTKHIQISYRFFELLFFSSSVATILISLVEAVSDLTTTELIGTANIFFFVLVISTVAVIPGLKGEYVVGL